MEELSLTKTLRLNLGLVVLQEFSNSSAFKLASLKLAFPDF